ncbi:MAG: hypothetical protein EOP51_07475 [Sphingobacteriales bacterium]|nr:MAG: hypothetical protein EOP51_07475 [Sphingobacteriales bacterium]
MKRTILSVSGIAAGLLLLATGCKKVDSNDLKEDVPFYQEYTVTYDKVASTTYANALLRVRSKDGSRVELTDGAYIRANGIDENDAQPTNNTYDWYFPANKDVRFDLGKNSGVVIANTFSLSDIGTIDFPSNLRSGFAKTEGMSFSWLGDDIDTDETLNITLSGASEVSPLVPWTNQVTVSGKLVTIDSTAVKGIAPGAVNIKMVRTRNTMLDAADGDAGGSVKIIETTNRTLQMGK